MNIAPAPLFRDPMYDGPTDPTIIYNRQEKAWWIIYTSRRANVPCHKVSWVHGTDLGVASSSDGGRTWLYRGVLELEAIEPGRNTFWAPEVLWANGLYHMFVSYITGVPDSWDGRRDILHYVSDDLWHWEFDSRLSLGSDRVIDACVYPIQDGYRLWYKNEADKSHTCYADSPDLYTWTPMGAATDDQSQEGPNVFALGGSYWMIADVWDGQAVYASDDLLHWKRQPNNLLQGPGIRPDDCNRAHHADVLTVGNRAYMFYFVHPTQDHPGDSIYDEILRRRSSLQAAQLYVSDGKLCVIRDEPFDFTLPCMA